MPLALHFRSPSVIPALWIEPCEFARIRRARALQMLDAVAAETLLDLGGFSSIVERVEWRDRHEVPDSAIVSEWPMHLTIEEISAEHLRRVRADSKSDAQAAKRLGVSVCTVWRRRTAQAPRALVGV